MANENPQPRQSLEDKALERFADLMIEKMESLQQDWKKPWFTEGAIRPPRNLSGRYYNGMNSLMLQLMSEKKGYKLPVFATFDRIQSLNFNKGKDGSWKFCEDKNGNKLPKVSVNSGEKSFPVFLTVFSVVNPETKEKIKYDDYKELSEEERAKYKVFPKLNVYNVFNLDQTNLKEARPELYAKLEKENVINRPEGYETGERFKFPAVDTMIKNDLWHCPIKEVYGDDAYYSISKDEIVVPEARQFIDNESFYSNLFHEMSHSTGSESRLNRLKPTSFGSKEYAREEAVAELSAAVVAAHYGMQKHVKEDSACYIKSWLDSLHEDPSFLKSVLFDVKRASSMLVQRVDKILLDLDKGIEPKHEDYKEYNIGEGNRKTFTPKSTSNVVVPVEDKANEGQEVKEEQVAEVAKSHGRGR